MSTRRAIIHNQADRLQAIRRFMPGNYVANSDGHGNVIIHGSDVAGWTLDAYVIPRLASGLYFAKEITDER